MKAVMYHYVRPAWADFPYFRYLHIDHFSRQLDLLARKYTFLDRAAFLNALASGESQEGVVLTFDDGFADHYDYVYPLLREKGLWGIFYIPTAICETEKILEVHRIHLLLGRYGGARAVEMLQEVVQDDMLSKKHYQRFRRHKIYSDQNDNEATKDFKRLLNFYISYEFREFILDELMKNHFGDESALNEKFYMTPDQIREIHQSGMLIGSHGFNHLLFTHIMRRNRAKRGRNLCNHMI